MKQLFVAGQLVIAIQIILLLAWVYTLFLRPNGVDPSGAGTAMVLVLGFAAYIVVGVLLLLTRRMWPMIITLILASIPIIIVATMLIKEYGNKSE